MEGFLVLLSPQPSTGRAAFAAAGLPLQRHDLYAAAAGAYALWGAAAVARALASLAAMRSTRRAAVAVGTWVGTAGRLGALGAVGVGALPLLVGLNLDLAMQPFRCAPPHLAGSSQSGRSTDTTSMVHRGGQIAQALGPAGGQGQEVYVGPQPDQQAAGRAALRQGALGTLASAEGGPCCC